jgi:hypothetical protein
MKATSEELTIFVAVVESGSFSRAAEQLGQANSAISRSVKKLEMKLGVSLQPNDASAKPDGGRRALFPPCAVRPAGDGGGRNRDYGNP